MNIADVKKYLNENVLYTLNGIEREWLFVGCTLRKNSKGFFYQAELKDLKANSVLIVKLEDVKPIVVGGEENCERT